MNEHFPEWYQIVNLTADHEVVKRRWDAVEKIAASLKSNNVVDLARTYHGLPSKSDDSTSELTSAVRASDAAFVANNRGPELAVLAGAVLFEALSSNGKGIGDLAALAVIVPGLRGVRKGAPLPQLLDASEQYLNDRSRELRSAKPAGPNAPGVPQDVVDAFAQALVDNQPPAASENLKKLVAAQTQIMNAQSKRLSQLEMNYFLLREESDILWWLTGAHSRITNQPFSKVDIGPASLLIGRELADLTRIIPGPLSTVVFVNRMLTQAFGAEGPATSLMIATAVNGLPAEVRAQWCAESSANPSIGLCPISAAVNHSTAVEKQNEWAPLFRKSQGLEALKASLHP